MTECVAGGGCLTSVTISAAAALPRLTLARSLPGSGGTKASGGNNLHPNVTFGYVVLNFDANKNGTCMATLCRVKPEYSCACSSTCLHALSTVCSENAVHHDTVMYVCVWKADVWFTVDHVASILVSVGSQLCVDGNVFLFNFLACLKWVFDSLLCTQYAILIVLEAGVLLCHGAAHRADSRVDLYMLLTLCSLIVFHRDHD